MRGASGSARVGDPALLATLARTAVLGFAVLIALNQLQIGAAIVNTLFVALVGTIALAAALAFGLGGREVAGRLLEDWDARRRQLAAPTDRLARTTREETRAAAPTITTARPAAPPAPPARGY